MTCVFRDQGRARITAELIYIAVCEIILSVASGTVWIYLFVLATLPTSFLPFYASTIGWGGLGQLGGGIGHKLITALWVLTPPIQIVLGRLAFRRRSHAA